jgi:hypothetical protein
VARHRDRVRGIGELEREPEIVFGGHGRRSYRR